MCCLNTKLSPVISKEKTEKTKEKSTKMKNKKNIITLDEILDNKYGIPGIENREEWKQEFETFRFEVLLERFFKVLMTI